MTKKMNDFIVASILTVPYMVLGIFVGEPVITFVAVICFFIVFRNNK